ncbi:MAG: hypothetical protein Aureis2KO_11380 [Aureisphaera sp.]
MIIRNLESVPFYQLIECFNKAFANYFVPMPSDAEFYKQRWKRAKVSYEDSFGMFDEDQLVGFMIHAIDERNGEKIAFNTGTGVLPEYRGKRIVQQLYVYGLPKLKDKGITRCSLEVITENTKAVKSYQNAGFAITKQYKCYSGTFSIETQVPPIELRKVQASHFNWEELSQQDYSWDNHIATLSAGSFDYYVVLHLEKEIAYFIIDPTRGYIAQFNIYEDSKEHWDSLFAAIQSISTSVRINNVDERLTSKIEYLKHIQLKNTVNQYEMEMAI